MALLQPFIRWTLWKRWRFPVSDTVMELARRVEVLREAVEDAISLIALLPVEAKVLVYARDATRKKLHDALANAPEATL
jgi:hypothetical protein